MAKPTKDEVESMQYVHNAQPFVEFSGDATIDLTDMQYVFQAKPFVRLVATSATTNTTRFFHFF